MTNQLNDDWDEQMSNWYEPVAVLLTPKSDAEFNSTGPVDRSVTLAFNKNRNGFPFSQVINNRMDHQSLRLTETNSPNEWTRVFRFLLKNNQQISDVSIGSSTGNDDKELHKNLGESFKNLKYIFKTSAADLLMKQISGGVAEPRRPFLTESSDMSPINQVPNGLNSNFMGSEGPASLDADRHPAATAVKKKKKQGTIFPWRQLSSLIGSPG